MKPKTLALIVLMLGAAWLLRELFPKRILVASPPRIRTVFDTVTQLDTLWRTRLVERRDTQYIERITVTPPETVRVAPPLIGLSALVIAPHVGDSSLAQGFRLAPADSGYALSQWLTQTYTPGPLRAFAFVDGKPILGWAPPPPKPCKLGCKAKMFLWGTATGWALGEVFR